nr:phosphoribosylglycinamide formyltransferase [uncultured Moellerella sp.]
MKKIVVLISGSGSNFQAIIDACWKGKIKGDVCAVFSNKPNVLGLVRAEKAGIPAFVIQPTDFACADAYDAALLEAIDAYAPDLIVLAGYMRILSSNFVRHFTGRMLNIHPSLLPKYPGLHTHRKALENGDKEHGTSVHFVTEQLDGGPVILQARMPIYADDTEEYIIERIKAREHLIYPIVIQWFVSGRLKMVDQRAVLDGVTLSAQGCLTSLPP